MKKKWILLLVLFTGVGIGLYYATKKQWQKKVISITATNQDIMDYIEKPENIVKWLADFKDSTNRIIDAKKITNGNISLAIPSSTLLKTEWIYNTANKKNTFYLKVLPTEDGYTNLEVFYKASWLGKLLQNYSSTQTIKDIAYLKTYLETPKLLYGIDIENSKVVDTFLLVTTKTIEKKGLLAEMENSYTVLITYAKDKGLGYTGTRIFHEKELGNGKVDLYTAIGINKLMDTKNENGFSFSQMPKGNLLVGHYSGSFKDRKASIDKFMYYAKKFRYQSMAIPFEKIIDTGIRFVDTQQVKINTCLPVY
jgi:effector-binding domain-containing protein